MCFTDGCSTYDGDPLQPKLWDEWGWWFLLVYFSLTLLVNIGVFNLIIGMFIESVMERSEGRKKMEIAVQTKYMEAYVSKMVLESEYFAHEIQHTGDESTMQFLDGHLKIAPDELVRLHHDNTVTNACIEVTAESFRQWIHDPLVGKL